MAITKNGIVYPDSYDEVADVPADLKKMAESVDKNIEQIQENIKDKNKEQDAKIENNINSINEIKQENINIKAENQRLRNDIESSQLVEEANGEFIDLSDCSNARFNKFEIAGNHKQEVREGYNLFNYKDVQVGKKIDGNTGNIVDDYSFCFAGYISVKENTNYTRSDVGTSTNLMLDENKQRIGTTSGVSFITPNGCAYVAFNIKREKYEDGSYLKFVMNEGTELKQFEEYGASPSPDFSSEIKTVKDSVEVKVVNKNLYDAEKYPFVKRIAYNFKGVLSYWNGYCGIEKFFPVSENSQYVFSNSLNMPFYCIIYYDNNKNQIKVETETKAMFTTPKKCRYVRFTIQKEEIPTWVQIEKGSTATDFVEHQEQKITMPVQQEMLKGDYFDFDREKEVHVMKKLVLQGTEAENKWTVVGNTETEWRFLISAEGILRTLSSTEIANIICNKLKTTSAYNTFLKETGISGDDKYDAMIIYIEECKDMTVSEFNVYLKQQYDAGTPFIIYYKLATPIEFDFTEEQKAVAKQIKETLHTYKNVTHIYSNDEISPIFDIQYVKDINVENDRLQKQIDEIKQLLSTTQTSAILLDNLQSDVESEVE